MVLNDIYCVSDFLFCKMNYRTYQQYLKSFTTPNGSIKYFDQGDGKPILLVHGVPTSSWLYRNVSRHLVEKGYRVIAPDMLGYGASDKPEGYEVYSAENAGNRLLELMHYLNISSWIQVFHDGGGLWTWEMLSKQPGKVEKLIMLNTIVYQQGFIPPMKFAPGYIAKLFTRLYCSRLGQSLAITGTFKNGMKDRSAIQKDMLEGYKLPLLQNGHRALYYFFTQTCKQIKDYSVLHQSLNIPLHVIWGKQDDMLVWEKIASKVNDNFKDIRSVDILDAKHFIQEELPDVIGKKIVEIVK